MTVAVFRHADQLVVALAGWDAFYGLRRRIAVPVETVGEVLVRRTESLVADRPALRSRGAYVPGVMTIGTFRRLSDGGRQFWCVRDAEEVLTVELAGADYERLVLQVTDPYATARELPA
ncbi:hypothetical protein [Fodinicola acaciae]|uniref:hypothetical protein n=1 Tax=Fodinicola acaciae TaxID=2681555 RepID=UPI0013D57628|nr:hypothetical protein [Fodinicola acaciae]